MKRLSCLILLICALSHVYGQDNFADTASLQKYSYLIYGRTRSGCTVQATGFLVRSKRQLYLVTACHVINGWYFESYDKDDVYPDTLYLRVFKRGNDSVAFIPLDIRKLKHIRPAPGSPDIYFFPLSVSPACRLNTLESLVDVSRSNVSPPAEVVAYGYNLTVDSDNVDFTKMAIHRAAGYWIDQPGNFTDPYIYNISYAGNALGPGDSGAPIYLVYKDKTGQISVQFGGLIFGGAPSLHRAMVIRPEIVRNLLEFYSQVPKRPWMGALKK